MTKAAENLEKKIEAQLEKLKQLKARKQAIGALKSRIQELDKATSRLNYQFIAVFPITFW